MSLAATHFEFSSYRCDAYAPNTALQSVQIPVNEIDLLQSIKSVQIPVNEIDLLQSIKDVLKAEHAVRRALGIVEVLKFRSVSASVQKHVENAWTRTGNILVPLSANRAHHPVSCSLGVLEDALGEFPLRALRCLCAVARRSIPNHSHAAYETEGMTCREANIVKWLLAGSCSFQKWNEPLGNSEMWLLTAAQQVASPVMSCTLGCALWPATHVVLDCFRKNHELGQGAAVLELGAGSGLVGLALASRAREVVLTDGDPRCVQLLQANAEIQESANRARLHVKGPLCFGDTTLPGEVDGKSKRFDLVVASDVLYASQVVHGGNTCQKFWTTADALLQDRLCLDATSMQYHSNTNRAVLLGFMARRVTGAPVLEDVIREAKSRSFDCVELASQFVADPANPSQSVEELTECKVLLFKRKNTNCGRKRGFPP